jgi:predicted DNA-binding transcriptional regulator AlpA
VGSAFALVALSRLGWRTLLPQASLPNRAWARAIAAMGRGEIGAWRARTEAWRPDQLQRLDPAAARHPFARLRLSPRAFWRWSAEWSWFAAAAPDVLVPRSSLGPEIGQPPIAVPRAEAVMPQLQPAPLRQASEVGRPVAPQLPRKRTRETGQPHQPSLFDAWQTPGEGAAVPATDVEAAPVRHLQATAIDVPSAPPVGHASERAIPPGSKLLSIRAVMALLGVSRTTFYRLVARGDFPEPVRLLRRNPRYVESEILDYARRKPIAHAGTSRGEVSGSN